MKRRFFAAIAVFAMILGAAGTGSAVFAQGAAAKGAFTGEQYKKALWMVTRFYGAQRSGTGPNWLLMDHAYKTSFVKDADGAYNLAGGWFDCGDHVLFGQTFFYSAYMLAKAYEAFPTGFHDLYNGKDYSDYAEAKKWGFEDGKPNTVPDLLEELKYATDWIIRATPNGTTFYSQKGNGDFDHKNWVTAGFMSTLAINDGGEKDGSRPIKKNPNDGVMASFASGTLALMSKIYRKYDAAYADTCLNHAKNAYAYANLKKNNSEGAGGYYEGHKDPPTVFVVAASEMYRATGESSYKSAINKADVKGHWHVFDYSNSHDLSAYAAALADSANKEAYLKTALDEFVTKYTNSGNINSEKVTTLGGGWGQMRYAGNTAFSVALYSLAKNVTQYDQFIYDQVDYILGNNAAKRSFLTGFCEGCGDKSPKMVHHRNVFLRDDNPDDAKKAQMTIPERNKQFGYLVGGTRTSSSYSESLTDYATTEGGIDYNAGLLGALAYIVSKAAPADTSKFGIVEPPPPPPQKPTRIEISLSPNPANATAFMKDSVHIDSIYIRNAPGKRLYAHIFDENDSVISNAVCDNITWKTSNRCTLPLPDGSPCVATHTDSVGKGCSIPAFPDVADDEITSIIATYVYAGADRPFISKTIKVFTPPPPIISVTPRNVSLAKQGYAVTIRPTTVTFKAAEGREITSISIYNIQGKRILTQSGNRKEITWNRANAPRGIYLFKVTMNNGSITQKNLILK